MDLTLSEATEAFVDCGNVEVRERGLDLNYRKILISENIEPKMARNIALQYCDSTNNNVVIVFNDGVFCLVNTCINNNISAFKIDALRHFKDQHIVCVWSPGMDHIWVCNRQEKKSKGIML